MDLLVLIPAACLIFGVFILAVIALVVLNRSGDDGPTRAPKSRPSSRPQSQQKYNWLIGRTGSVEGKTFHVGKRLATIGRGVGNFIQISDENSSRVHAQFKGAASGMQIKDMGSSNGTLVNGEKISQSTFRPLSDGDKIKIGDTLLVYRKMGDFKDQALTGTKNVGATQQKQTQALGAVAGGGSLEDQIRQAVKDADGDIDAAADKLGLDADVVKTIVAAGEET